MWQIRSIFSLLFILFFTQVVAQKAFITGIVKDEHHKPIDSAVVFDEITGFGAYTNKAGYYLMEITAGKEINIIYGYPGFLTKKITLNLNTGQTKNIDIVLKENMLGTVLVKGKFDRNAGSIPFERMLGKVDYNPGVIGGIEGIIKTQTGSHDELSSQYSVRGGNFDENLVYVNDFEIYRPFLVRAGQQEGLSFVNSDLVADVNFSVGGFQAKYGDKMSSVLDVTYKKPTEFAGSVALSLLGANLHLEGCTKNQKLSYLIGARQKSNQYILQSQPTQGVYNPSFTDIQTLINYRPNANWELEAIGNYARNRFTFFPETQTSSFGLLNQAYQLRVFYTGSEFDQFDSKFGGISAAYHPDSTSPFKIKFLASGFQTNEYETFDIAGEYLFGELQTDISKKDFGQIKTYLGTGMVQDFARNYLNVNVGNVGFKGSYELKNNLILFGSNATFTNISDDLHQWERRDSAGFSQPYNPYLLRMAYFYNSSADFNYTRVSAYLQDLFKFDSGRFSVTAGLRFNYSFLNSEMILSPRLQVAFKPYWMNDWVFKMAAGNYAQPPFYREMRDWNGNVNTQLKAQQSNQYVLGADNNFKMFNRPYKFIGEIYYKDLKNLDPYIYNNIQIQYTGKNDAIGYVYGGELRLYGDIVKDATSWISIGIMKGEQKITDSNMIAGYKSYFPLPSDQRFMLGMYFEDYLPRNKNFKVHINLMYASGLPVGSPWSHMYQDLLRLPDYKRVDIGFSALLLDTKHKELPAHSLFNNLHTIWMSLEVFNLLGIQNTLSYSWIQDDTSQLTFAVPNRLTSRLLNLKMLFKF